MRLGWPYYLSLALPKNNSDRFFSTRRSPCRNTGVCPPCAPLTCRCKSSAVTKPRPQAHEKGYLQPRRHGIPRPSKYQSKWIKIVLYHVIVVLLQFLGGTWRVWVSQYTQIIISFFRSYNLLANLWDKIWRHLTRVSRPCPQCMVVYVLTFGKIPYDRTYHENGWKWNIWKLPENEQGQKSAILQ